MQRALRVVAIMAEPPRPVWIQTATEHITALPPIIKFLIDLGVGCPVFELLYLATLVIHHAYFGAIANNFDSWQIWGLWGLEELFFWLDIAGVGIYISLRFLTHAAAFLRG